MWLCWGEKAVKSPSVPLHLSGSRGETRWIRLLLPDCQRLLLPIPTPANYSVTFSWTLYRGTPSHYGSQLAAADGPALPHHERPPPPLNIRRSARTPLDAATGPLRRGRGGAYRWRVTSSEVLFLFFTRLRDLGAGIRVRVCVCHKDPTAFAKIVVAVVDRCFFLIETPIHPSEKLLSKCWFKGWI